MVNSPEFSNYLQSTDIIDWKHPKVADLARDFSRSWPDPTGLIRHTFEWVRDEVLHSHDHAKNPVTCLASEVLEYRTGYCFAKSHLLAALLRANGVPAGFCYQRLRMDDEPGRYSLHGFCAVKLPSHDWYRLDPRGNKEVIDAQFIPPIERLAYLADGPGEVTYGEVYADPLPSVVKVLKTCKTWDEVWKKLPSTIPN